MKDSDPNTPLVIVGGGPVGLVLALLLDRFGVRTTVYNAETSVRQHPKGNTHGARTMEIYRLLGLSEQIRAMGLPAEHPTDVAYFTSFGGWELARLPMPSTAEKMRMVASSAKADQVPEPIHRANQMYVEKFLADHVRTRPNITARFGWTVKGFSDEGEGVSVTAEENETGRTETLRCQYLVGCDGGRSFVRRSLGIEYGGYEALRQAFFGGRMVSTYLRIANWSEVRASPAWQYWILNPAIRSALVSLNGRDEFFGLFRATDLREESEQELMRLIMSCVGPHAAVKLVSQHPWTAGVALVAERYSEGRVFLAGDSVHLFTPTGGFGMNTGIEDAANLAWKLAAMVKRWGGENLLASYELERRPIAVRNTTACRALAINLGGLVVEDFVEETSERGEAARRQLTASLAGFGEEFASVGIQLGARYDGSPVIFSEATAAPTDDPAQYKPTTLPGGRLPHFWIGTGQARDDSIFDQLGRGFALLRVGPNAASAAPLLEAARAAKVPLKVLDVPDEEARDLYDRDLVLIRPDQHVCWRGNSIPPDPARLLARVTGSSAAKDF